MCLGSEQRVPCPWFSQQSAFTASITAACKRWTVRGVRGSRLRLFKTSSLGVSLFWSMTAGLQEPTCLSAAPGLHRVTTLIDKGVYTRKYTSGRLSHCSRQTVPMSSAVALSAPSIDSRLLTGSATYVENKGAQTSASWLSGGPFQRQIIPQATPSFGQPRPISHFTATWAALAGRIGLVFHIGRPCQ